MANAIYPKWRQEVQQGTANTSLGGTVKAALIDTGSYTYSAAHVFMSSVTGITARSGALSSKTHVDGLFDAADAAFTAVTGAVSEALILYTDTGSDATSRLIAYFDTGVTGLPVTPNGGDINIQWNASGIFQL